MKISPKIFLLSALLMYVLTITAYGRKNMENIVFATFAQDESELEQALVLARSLRTYGGDMKEAPFWLYLPAESSELPGRIGPRSSPLNIEVRTSATPEAARDYYYSGKTFAAGTAEGAAAGNFKILAWLDADNIIAQEPKDFILKDGICFGWRPVMLKLIGSAYNEPPDEFWSRLYVKLSVKPKAIFPVTTPVDSAQIRAYFNAGILIVRPERGILRKWPVSYEKLYSDPFYRGECKKDVKKRIFLHQTALAGAVLNMLSRDEMACLDDRYNYPFFFFDKYPVEKQFKSLDDAITIRHDGIMYQDKEWKEKMKDTSKIAEWIKQEFSGSH
ncbi:MAG: hypothetical protein RDU76_05475 [Candidatus Edwardsbacteria bacterium]|nr:hypothetical protein [Candidatus Edwardsbacteria bacterium]